jgi:opacity protein-like surface antigen
MKAALSFSLTAVLSAILTVIAAAQDLPAKQSLGISFGYSPDSSHILIGISEQRRTWTGGVEYGRTLYGNNSIRADYEASVSPFFLERDPTASGSYAKLPDGSIENFPGVPTRVVKINGAPIGYIGGIGPTPIPIYADGFGTEETYAASISPLGARINGFNSHRLQPTFSADLGLVFSGRNLPVDQSSSVNFLFSFGPGVELFYKPNRAVRLEYLYRHMSNANIGITNPGVDQGVLRVTLTQRRK